MTPIGVQAAQQRIAEIHSRFAQSGSSFAAGLAQAERAASRPPPPASEPLPAPGAAAPALAGAAAPVLPSAAAPALSAAARPALSAAAAPLFPSAAAGTAPAAAAPAAPAPQWAAGLPPQAQPWIGALESAAGAAGIDARLLAAVVQTESGFKADARSSAGAVGLGQLMPATARGLGVDPHDPADNLRGAARYLRSQLDRFGSVELALAAYNAGPGRVAQAGGIPRIQETQQYVTRVVASYDRLRSR